MLPYRRGVGIALFNDQGRVFTGKRIDNPGPAWQMPQGGIDKDEDPIAAALRELQEETGVASHLVHHLGTSGRWLKYDLPPDLIPTLWGGKYRGQEQLWFAFRFLGADGDIDIATAHPEFSAWQWADFNSIAASIVPFKRDLYDQLISEFRHLILEKE